MLKFVLILTLYLPDGTDAVYVLDHNLTGEDCVTQLAEYVNLEEDIKDARLSCEIDNAAEEGE